MTKKIKNYFFSGCPADYFTCVRQACISPTRICDLTDDCGDNSDELNCTNYTQCDFESGICDWRSVQGIENRLTWNLGSGETSSMDTGPSRDHTTGSSEGHYIFLEASNPANSTAQVISSVFLPSQRLVLKIYL